MDKTALTLGAISSTVLLLSIGMIYNIPAKLGTLDKIIAGCSQVYPGIEYKVHTNGITLHCYLGMPQEAYESPAERRKQRRLKIRQRK